MRLSLFVRSRGAGKGDRGTRAAALGSVAGHVFIVRGDERRIDATAHVPLDEKATMAVARAAEARADATRRDADVPRDRPLIAAAVRPVRDAAGGAALVADLRALIEDERSRGDADVVVVAPDMATFTAALAVRRRVARSAALSDPSKLAAARELAARARAGELVVFVGAGVSTGAGVPDWCDLVSEVARSFGMSASEIESLEELPLLDRAAIVERRALASGRDGRATLRRALARLVKRDHAALAHHLLANLPTRQFVTTNYDDLFELALEGAGRRTSVLPYRRVEDGDGWLLKLHGCVRKPDDIVFTREDYLRYEDGRVALAGIMQALLFTQHVLFVGFSLNDDHFHKIADAVRSGERGRAGRAGRFGTALVLEDEPLRRELWESDVRWVAMRRGRERSEPKMDERERLECARTLEIVLDEVLAGAWPTGPHVLDPRFASALDPAERALKATIERFVDATTELRWGPSAAWKRIEDALASLGLGQMGSAQQRKPIE